ncbi:head-tail connector protein [Pseudomonas sp. GW531-T4]|uniref:head-tail connector protein n=1 Tax=Pseudomonas sp. GW531-T4 TaxID=2075553 RepID=UPI000CD26446|nr:head-tail connector protein [Pseudomonas sp. GW531-T4]POA75356.1 phage gp6-like head-tail connector protein [Pseudomonas sp. GW531-T4]
MIDLATVKAQLRVDHDDEDELIQGYTEAALSAFETWTNRKLVDPLGVLPDPVGNSLFMTKGIRQGALLLIGQWYVYRETVASGSAQLSELPMATQALWRPHRWSNI